MSLLFNKKYSIAALIILVAASSLLVVYLCSPSKAEQKQWVVEGSFFDLNNKKFASFFSYGKGATSDEAKEEAVNRINSIKEGQEKFMNQQIIVRYEKEYEKKHEKDASTPLAIETKFFLIGGGDVEMSTDWVTDTL